jgi:hypothetical protein
VDELDREPRAEAKRTHETYGDRIYVHNTDFAEVLTILRAMPGARAEREGWPLVETERAVFTGPHLVWVPGSTITVTADRPLGQALPHQVGRQVRYLDHVDRVDPLGVVGPWAAAPEDVVASDWTVSWPRDTSPRRSG